MPKEKITNINCPVCWEKDWFNTSGRYICKSCHIVMSVLVDFETKKGQCIGYKFYVDKEDTRFIISSKFPFEHSIVQKITHNTKTTPTYLNILIDRYISFDRLEKLMILF